MLCGLMNLAVLKFSHIFAINIIFLPLIFMFPMFTSVITPLLFVALRNLQIVLIFHIKYFTGKQSSSLLLLVFHQTAVLQAVRYTNIALCQTLLFLVQITMPFVNAYFRHEERDEDGTYVCISFLSSKGGRQQDRS